MPAGTFQAIPVSFQVNYGPVYGNYDILLHLIWRFFMFFSGIYCSDPLENKNKMLKNLAILYICVFVSSFFHRYSLSFGSTATAYALKFYSLTLLL